VLRRRRAGLVADCRSDSVEELCLKSPRLQVAACQSVSGTGAVRLAFEFFRNYLNKPVWCSKPTWGRYLS
jgi:aspartate/tyrosine/aromatic aminotransferase